MDSCDICVLNSNYSACCCGVKIERSSAANIAYIAVGDVSVLHNISYDQNLYRQIASQNTRLGKLKVIPDILDFKFVKLCFINTFIAQSTGNITRSVWHGQGIIVLSILLYLLYQVIGKVKGMHSVLDFLKHYYAI